MANTNRTYIKGASYSPVHWVDNYSYLPIVNGYMMQTYNTKTFSLKKAAKLFQVMYNLVYNL